MEEKEAIEFRQGKNLKVERKKRYLFFHNVKVKEKEKTVQFSIESG